MIEVLRQDIINRLGSDIDNLDYVLSHFGHMQVLRNQQLLKEGEVCRYVYFVAKGCLQVYINEDGNENTRDIITEHHWCSELISFGQQQPSFENIRAVEPCELLYIDRNGFQKLMETIPHLIRFISKYLKPLMQTLFTGLIPLYRFPHSIESSGSCNIVLL